MTVPLAVDEDVIVLITRWYLHRQPGSQSFLQTHLMSPRHAFDIMLQWALQILVSILVCFCSTPTRWRFQGWAVSSGGTWIGPYTATLIHCSFGVLFDGCFLSETSVHARMFPSVMFPSLVVLSYQNTDYIRVTASFSAPIVSVLTDCSLNGSVMFRYTLQIVDAVFVAFSCKCRHCIASWEWMKHRKRSWLCWS